MIEGYVPIADYGLIGDCRAAALISRDGSLDGLGWPRFDSPSLFAALLDTHRGGRFRIRPIGPFRTERRYLPGTNVLETVFTCPSGVVALRDLMPVASEEERRMTLDPEHEVLREVEGLSGEVELEIVYEPRPDYARYQPQLVDRGPFGIWCQSSHSAVILRGDFPLQISSDGRGAYGGDRIRSGERRFLSLSLGREAPAVIPALGERAIAKVNRTVHWWREWASRCAYEGPYRDAVVRSALALKALAFAPSGAIVAAPTTSLPEHLGGTRNWDYRYCWLRDASFTVRALFALDYQDEAEAFLGWLLHATRLTSPQLHVLYDVYGEVHLPEQELTHLEGYACSRPVRIGNDAHGQLQLDVYGEVIDAVARFAARGGRFESETITFLNDLGRVVCERWREADEGIWEGRAGHFHHTHSKVLGWVALDRLIGLHETRRLTLDADRFRIERDLIRAEIEARGFNPRLGSYTRLFDGDDLDASLLLLPLYGYIDGAHPRMRSTCSRVHEELGHGPLISRYHFGMEDGLPAGEGAFGICSFWGVECRARGGDVHGAAAAFELLLSYANDLGLFAEEIDPDTGEALGNFPQALTHVGLINAALTLAECEASVQQTAAGERRS